MATNSIRVFSYWVQLMHKHPEIFYLPETQIQMIESQHKLGKRFFNECEVLA